LTVHHKNVLFLSDNLTIAKFVLDNQTIHQQITRSQLLHYNLYQTVNTLNPIIAHKPKELIYE